MRLIVAIAVLWFAGCALGDAQFGDGGCYRFEFGCSCSAENDRAEVYGDECNAELVGASAKCCEGGNDNCVCALAQCFQHKEGSYCVCDLGITIANTFEVVPSCSRLAGSQLKCCLGVDYKGSGKCTCNVVACDAFETEVTACAPSDVTCGDNAEVSECNYEP